MMYMLCNYSAQKVLWWILAFVLIFCSLTMPRGSGKCCAIPSCPNYYMKTKDAATKISYMKIPDEGVSKKQDEWRSQMIHLISRGEKNYSKVKYKFICNRHFPLKDLLFSGTGYKIAFGCLPTLELDKKSHPTKVPDPRKLPAVREPPLLPHRVKYFTFDELRMDANNFCIEQNVKWKVLRSDPQKLVIGLMNEEADTTTKVTFDGNFVGSASRFGYTLSKKFDCEIRGLRSVLVDVEALHWCLGSKPRSLKCLLTLDLPGICTMCTKRNEDNAEKLRGPVHKNTPISSMPRPKLEQELKHNRQKLKQACAELASVKTLLASKDMVKLDKGTQDGLTHVLDNTEHDNSFMKLFWEQQKLAAVTHPNGMRWHPMVIRFAIYLQFQSNRAYEALRNSGTLYLPHGSTLRNYTNVVQPGEGIQDEVFEEIYDEVKNLPESDRYVCLLHDEIQIRSDLVYDKRSGKIIGFVNPQFWNFKDSSEMSIATHMLVFMIVGVNNKIKRTVGYYATKAATAEAMYPVLWETVAMLEQAGLKVITSTSDKASPNQKLIRMHGEGKVVPETMNYYSNEARPLFFISDPPHLIKTLRNALESSKTGGTRYLWRNGKHLLWDHVRQIYYDEGQLHMTKLTRDHVFLTSSAKMSVRFAAQVLSKKVSEALKAKSDEYSETAMYAELCNRFFDCLNGRSFKEHINKRLPDMAPFTTVDDPRFNLIQMFADYLTNWRNATLARAGFSLDERHRMFIPDQTYEGVLTTVAGFTGAVRYMLSNGVKYILAHVFSQDPLEQHFGRHRGLGRRSRNPNPLEFGYQDRKLAFQRQLAFQFQPKGNVSKGRTEGLEVDERPLKRKKKQ